MNSHKLCCLLVSGWLGRSGKTPYRMNDEGRGPDYVMSLLMKLEQLGVKFVTKKADAISSNLPFFELHLEVQVPRLKKCPRFLILLEEKHIRPQNYFLNKYNYDLIFTWDPDIASKVSGQQYVFPSYFSIPPVGDFNERKQLLTLISANKGQTIHTRYDLYKERRKIVAWYEQNYSDCFVHFGPGWNLPDHPNGLLAKLTFKFLKKLNVNTRRSRANWRGVAESKLYELSKSKFNLCFENYRGAKGYVTEKIFDAFSCGTVPIYWGAEDIYDLVPSKCFIDYRQFTDIGALHQYISNMNKEEYTVIQENIRDFQQKSWRKFSIEKFANDVSSQILQLTNKI